MILNAISHMIVNSVRLDKTRVLAGLKDANKGRCSGVRDISHWGHFLGTFVYDTFLTRFVYCSGGSVVVCATMCMASCATFYSFNTEHEWYCAARGFAHTPGLMCDALSPSEAASHWH